MARLGGTASPAPSPASRRPSERRALRGFYLSTLPTSLSVSFPKLLRGGRARERCWFPSRMETLDMGGTREEDFREEGGCSPALAAWEPLGLRALSC